LLILDSSRNRGNKLFVAVLNFGITCTRDNQSCKGKRKGEGQKGRSYTQRPIPGPSFPFFLIFYAVIQLCPGKGGTKRGPSTYATRKVSRKVNTSILLLPITQVFSTGKEGKKGKRKGKSGKRRQIAAYPCSLIKGT